jgi:hypothetical protein
MAAKLDRRRHGRKVVSYLATLAFGRDILSCYVLDFSDGGARVALRDSRTVVRGAARLSCSAFGDFPAEVVWQKGALVGLRFENAPSELRPIRASRKRASRPPVPKTGPLTPSRSRQRLN